LYGHAVQNSSSGKMIQRYATYQYQYFT
jgi:hypothetical protein